MKRILAVIFLLSLPLTFTANAGKISDYEYDEIDERLYFANRSAKKCVALTFDDGPSPKYTERILDILDKYGAKATFFVIGKNAEKYPEIVIEEYRRGHEIGNHTYSHPDLKKISAEQFIEEINKTQSIIYDITGVEPTLFRPPGGYLNNSIVSKLHELDYSSVLWSWRQDTRDWACPSVGNVVNGVLGNLQDGDIILFHDYNSKESPTPEALDRILSELCDKGYSFVTVSELIEIE